MEKNLYRLVLLLLVSATAQADLSYTDDKIKSIWVYFGRVIVETVSPHNKSCGDGNNDKNTFELSKDNGDFSEMYSALLAAKAAQLEVKLISAGAVCREWWEVKRPELVAVAIN